MKFGLREDYRIREIPAYCDQSQRGEVFQPEVYELAVQYARQNGSRFLIDLGCGQGVKLQPYFEEFHVIGIDYGPNMDYCRETYTDTGTWLSCNLDVVRPWVDEDVLMNAVIVSADVVEHLINPANWLAILYDWLYFAPVAVVSTPDRLVVYGKENSGPPMNPSHVREWTTDEFQALLERCNFTIVEHRHTRTSNQRNTFETATFVISR